MTIIDHVAAHQLEDGDQVLIDLDPLENITVQHMDGHIWVRGFSWNTGDLAVYLLDPDREVSIWSV